MLQKLGGLLCFLLPWACAKTPDQAENPAAPSRAQRLVDKAITAHGLDDLDGLTVSFDFRERHYRAQFVDGQYRYERIFQDSSGVQYRDVLQNDGLFREKEGRRIDLPAKDSAAYANSVNSVIYFALLPVFLNDPAVRKTYLGSSSLRGEPYEKVMVTFRQEGGGKDYEDEFVYWFHGQNHTLDYLAYNYQTDGGGARMREAFHIRTIGGIRFADYINYKPRENSMDVARFDSLLEDGRMQELSRIRNEKIEVGRLDE